MNGLFKKSPEISGIMPVVLLIGLEVGQRKSFLQIKAYFVEFMMGRRGRFSGSQPAINKMIEQKIAWSTPELWDVLGWKEKG